MENKQQYLVQHIDTDSEGEQEQKSTKKSTLKSLYFPVPIQTCEIKLQCDTVEYRNVVNEYLQARLKFELENELENWTVYYEKLDTLYKLYSSIPIDKRIEYISVVGVAHKFVYQLRHDQEWYEIDLTFEYTCCLIAGSILLASYVCTESNCKRNITDKSNDQSMELYAQVTLNLFTLLDTKNLTCSIRNRYLPCALRQSTLHCYSTVFYSIRQLRGVFRLMNNINIKATIETKRMLSLTNKNDNCISITYDEVTLSEEVVKHFDDVLSRYIGLFSVRNMYIKAFHYLNSIKLMLPDIVFKYINKKMDEVRLNVKSLIHFVPRIKKEGNRVKKMNSLLSDYKKLTEVFPSIAIENVTMELMDVIKVQKIAVEKRAKQLIFTMIEHHSPLMSTSKDITHYIANEKIKAIYEF